MDNSYYLRNYNNRINVMSDSKLMRKKSSKLNHLQLNPSKTKGSLLAKKKKKDNGVWMLVLLAFVIALFALLRSKGYFS